MDNLNNDNLETLNNTLDIISLIDKNPLTKLSGNYQHNLLNKIKQLLQNRNNNYL